MKRLFFAIAVLAATVLAVNSCVDINGQGSQMSTSFTAISAVLVDNGSIGSDGASNVELYVSNSELGEHCQLKDRGTMVMLSLNVPAGSEGIPTEQTYTVAEQGKYLPYTINLGEQLSNERPGCFVAEKSDNSGSLIPAVLVTDVAVEMNKDADGKYHISGVCKCYNLIVSFTYDGDLKTPEPVEKI